MVRKIVAYYDFDQSEIGDVGEDGAIHYYKKTYLAGERDGILNPEYSWNDVCQIHEMYDTYDVTFIHEDDRFMNRRYHKVLEQKIGRPFPSCLQFITIATQTREDAKKIETELRAFFPDDKQLMKFADWLGATAKYCSTYEIM